MQNRPDKHQGGYLYVSITKNYTSSLATSCGGTTVRAHVAGTIT